MGGDQAPAVIVEGAVRAVRGAPDRLHVLLFGEEEAVGAELAHHDTDGLPIEVAHAPEAIGMGDAPAVALKAKRGSSVHLGLRALKAGEADAFASAGNTGAVMAAALFICGRLPGVLRPCVPGYFPTPDRLSIILDVGANVDVKAEHLVQFAQMGRIFARRVLDIEEPSIGLVNVGEEKGKGTDTVKEAYERLEALDDAGRLHFVGNVEGRDLFGRRTDVSVCDGFVGNALLKLGESFAATLPHIVEKEMAALSVTEHEADLIRRVVRAAIHPFDHEAYGGVPLLGVDGVVVIGHGGSPAHAVEQMIYRAAEMVERNLTERIAEAFKE